ncbi:ZIP family metal transporter [candidate division WOR-3 bacterium]|nr:ZIP family metal transporter [candidate division WOR-3 bacterium]
MEKLLLIVILIFAGQILGSLLGLIKSPSKIILHGSLAFAGSMMILISFFQLIPKGLEYASYYLIMLSFFAGIGIMWPIDKLVPHINPELGKKEKSSVKRSTIMLVIGMALHNIPEGLAIGIGFALEPKLGITIAIAIAAQDIPENIATIIPLYNVTKQKLKSFIITTGTILFELIGFILGYFVLRGMSTEILGASLALAGGFMVYISVEELLPAAEISKHLRVCITAIIMGAICIVLTSLI